MSLQIISTLARAQQEDGTMAGEGLTATQTFITFVAVPVALFLVISLLAYAMTADRKNKSGKSSITSID
jgi:uncharacterized membrane protein